YDIHRLVFLCELPHTAAPQSLQPLEKILRTRRQGPDGMLKHLRRSSETRDQLRCGNVSEFGGGSGEGSNRWIFENRDIFASIDVVLLKSWRSNKSLLF